MDQEHIFDEPEYATVAIKSIWGVYGYVYGHNDMVSNFYRQKSKKKGFGEFNFSSDKKIDQIISANAQAHKLFLASLRQELLFVDHIYVPSEEYSTLLGFGIEELSSFCEKGAIKLTTLSSLSKMTTSLKEGHLVMESKFSIDGYELSQAVHKSFYDLMAYQFCLSMLLLGSSEYDIRLEDRSKDNREEHRKIFRKMKSWGIAKSTKKYLELGNLNHDLQTRYWCQLAYDKYGVLPIPLVNTFAHYEQLPREDKGENVSYQDVVRVILKKIPMPSIDFPLDEFIDFRESAEHKNCYYALKKWMRNTSKIEANAIELEEELEYLISEYESFMKLQKIKIKKGAFQTVLTTGAEVIENMAKLNFSKAAKSIFDIKNRKIALMEVERTAPGREVSYIVNSQKKLLDDL